MAYGYSTDLSDYDIGERKGQKIPRGEMEGYLAQERGLADQTYEDLAEGRLSVAQQQMQAGLAGTQRALATQAAAGGANPMAARGASYAGGMAGADVSRQTAALRAQEMQAARQMQMGALQRGTEGILQQQQMDLQAQQLEAQMLAEERLREEGKWGKTKDIVDMASFGFISDPRMKDVYASDPATKTISAYIPQGGGRYGAAMPMPVYAPPRMVVEVPNPSWYPGDVSGPEEIVVPSSRPAMPPTIMDYVNRGAYGPQAPVRQPGRAAGGAAAAGKASKKGEAPGKGAVKGAKAVEEGSMTWEQLIHESQQGYPMEQYYAGEMPWGVYGPDPSRMSGPEELARYGDAYRRPLYVEKYSQAPSYQRESLPQDRPWENPFTGEQESEAAKNAEARHAGEVAQLRAAQEKGLITPARVTQRAPLGPEGSENWEQMARRIEAEQRRKYYEQGGPGL